MIKRKIDNYLEDFYSNHRQALLITGARQVGKTYSIRQFGQSHFECFFELNFAENATASRIVANSVDANDLLLRLSLLSSQPLKPGNTLIFFDEVQECPEIITAIKFLVDDGRFRYILSGSLLGVDLNNIQSVPVGYMAIKEMFPIDFEEFIRAIGVQEDVIGHLHDCYFKSVPVDSFIHDKLMQIYRLYLVVGGMPAAVQCYIDSHDLQRTSQEQSTIIELYKRDIAKYDPQHKLYINEIYNLIAPELNAKNKRFILKKLNENTKFSRIENSFIWLKEAGVALPTYNVEEPKVPLLLARSRNLFKLFLSDVGLLATQYAQGIQLRIISGDKEINYGAVYENFIAQELHSHGFALYYFNSKRQGEVDFLIEMDGNVVPIEVKSGKDYERHNAIGNIISNEEYNIKRAVVFCNDNIKKVGIVTYLPIYMAMFVNQTTNTPLIHTINLSGISL